MARANFQVLILPFLITDSKEIKYCIFNRKDMNINQFIAGGGEDDETPLKAAKRELFEETGIVKDIVDIYTLDTKASIPACIFKKDYHLWPKDCIVITEHSFAIQIKDEDINLSDEHSSYEWVTYDEACNKLRYDSNKTALLELKTRIERNLLK